MRVRACIVKPAQFKASAEEGKYSEAYNREATHLLVHPENMAAWGLKDGMHVSCSFLERNETSILVVTPSKNVRMGLVNIIESPWTNCMIHDAGRFIEIDVEPSGANVAQLEHLFTSKRPLIP